MKNRKTPISGFYCNLTIWENYYRDKWFPYTMPISDIMGLDVALDNILEEGLENVHKRHANVADATRKAVEEYGLKLFLENGYSNTVTVVDIPEEIGAGKLVAHLLEKYNLVMTTSLAQYTGKILRIGHMGENAKHEAIVPVLNYLDLGLKDLGFKTDKNLVELFNKYYNA
ncbi:MAG: alanine--glyoxylate aminotransferase family protein, partial [Intestinibacter sp.]